MKKYCFILLFILAFSCTKEAGKVDEQIVREAPVVIGCLPQWGLADVRVSGIETQKGDYALCWEKGDVISGCWKNESGKWQHLCYKVDSIAWDGKGIFSLLSGEAPVKAGTLISMVCLGDKTSRTIDGDNPLNIDFSDQSDRIPVLLFASAALSTGIMTFDFSPLSSIIRIAGAKGLPDLDFQGVTDYFPELRVSGSYLGIKGSLAISSDGKPVLSTSSAADGNIVLSRSKYGSGKASARQTRFNGGKESDISVAVLPFTADASARSDLRIQASAIYGSYADTIRQTSVPIASGEYVRVQDTLHLLPPSVSQYGDANRVVGWGRCKSATDTSYVLDGGRRGKRTVVLTATGDDGARTRDAILNNDIVILDGSKGDFVFQKNITIQKTTTLSSHVENKTIVGVNNAFLRTKWHLTEGMVSSLTSVIDGHKYGQPKYGKYYSQSTGTGDFLYSANDPSDFSSRWEGKHPDYNPEINNENELIMRRAMVDLTGNPLETYRDSSGVWRFNGAQNMIIRNLRIRSAGAVDVNGRDPITLCTRDASVSAQVYEAASNHVWIDHCDLSDGMDGNLDIDGLCDFVSVSWTEQHYTPGINYGHKYSCLIGSGDSDIYKGKGHITFDFCKWGEGIQSRTPLIRYGVAHMLNNYYSYRGTGTHMVDPQGESSIFLDHCYFVGSLWWISSAWEKATAVKLDGNYNLQPQDYTRVKGDVSIPYSYPVYNAAGVNYMVDRWVGPTLSNPLDFN